MIQATTIIAEINKFMKQNNLKLTQLARRSEINTGTISAVISGARPLAVDQMDLKQWGFQKDIFIRPIFGIIFRK